MDYFSNKLPRNDETHRVPSLRDRLRSWQSIALRYRLLQDFVLRNDEMCYASTACRHHVAVMDYFGNKLPRNDETPSPRCAKVGVAIYHDSAKNVTL